MAGELLNRSFLYVLLLTLILVPGVIESKELQIALLLWRGETTAEKGFKDGLEERGYSVNFSTFDVEQDVTKLGTALNLITSQTDSYDYIYTFGTTVSRRAQIVIGNKVPQIFNVVTDPAGAGIVETNERPGANISGASDAVPLAQLFEILTDNFKFKKLGFFFNPREKNSMLIREKVYASGNILGFDVVDFRSPPVAESLQQNLYKIIHTPGLVDAVFFPGDSFLVSNAALIGEQLQSSKILSFGTVRNYMEHGVLFGLAVDYYGLGKSVAVIVDRNQRGEELSQISVAQAEFSLMINKTTKDMLGLQIPQITSFTYEVIE